MIPVNEIPPQERYKTCESCNQLRAENATLRAERDSVIATSDTLADTVINLGETIVKLKAERDRLCAALKPFAHYCKLVNEMEFGESCDVLLDWEYFVEAKAAFDGVPSPLDAQQSDAEGTDGH